MTSAVGLCLVCFPLQPLLVLLEDSLAYQWRAGHWLCSGGQYPASDQRGPLTGYRLHYSNGTSIVNTYRRGEQTACVDRTDSIHQLLLQVAAVNAGGLDHTVQLSLWRHCRIVSNEQIIIVALLVCSCTVPGPVSGLSATPGVVQLTISWTAPSEPNGVITMYQVTHNSTGVLNYTNTSARQLHTEGPPSQHCCWIQCQSIHYHRTRRCCFKHCINYRYSWVHCT